ncbi:SdpI family protein [Nocardia mangyaensis]|uniref:SdpI family protein n=1 Tax=Nocardia mangyaensis TaxID=2213200 RepID=UPI002674D094|nr:SdpI family protein [Nocardia mangyaensis]MDO3649418.1 SdpI family protein [Nocardia mangyaensis]
MVVVALLLFALAAVAIATGVLGLIGKLPRNRFVGVTTEAALHSDDNFRIANRIAAPTSVGAGFLLFAGGLVALVAGGFAALGVAVLVAVVAIFTLGAGATAAARTVEPLMPPAPVGGCGSSCGGCSLRETCAPAN